MQVLDHILEGQLTFVDIVNHILENGLEALLDHNAKTAAHEAANAATEAPLAGAFDWAGVVFTEWNKLLFRVP